MEAFKLTPEEFDQQFDKYLKDRFKPFRDKERPADYGRNLAPDPEKSPFIGAVSIEPSPSGDLIAMVTGNRTRSRARHRARVGEGRLGDPQPDQRLRPGQGLRVHRPARHAVRTRCRGCRGRRPATGSPTSCAREKSRTLILQNVLNRQRRAAHRDADGGRSRVARHLAGRQEGGVRRAAGRRRRHLRRRSGSRGEVTNLTKDDFADSGPTWSPDGRSIIYVARVSGNEKLFRLDVATGQKTQLTFGTHDDSRRAVPRRRHARVLVDGHRSGAADRSRRRAQRQHLQHLDAQPEERRAAAVHRRARRQHLGRRAATRARAEPRIAFVSYYKGEYELHTLERRDPIVTAASADFGAPGPIIDFQAPLSHTLIAENKRKKGTFEKLFLDGRPPVNVGVTSGGDVFGGSAVTFSDVLGDKQFNLYAASISQYRTLSFSYLNLARRFNYAVQGYSQTQFFYGAARGRLLRPGVRRPDRPRLRRGDAHGPRRQRRSASGRSTAIAASSCSAASCSTSEEFNDPSLQEYSAGLPAAAVRPAAVPSRAPTSRSASTSSRRRPSSASSVRWPATRCGCRTRSSPKIGDTLVAADRRRRRALLPAAGRLGPAGAARPRLQELGRRARLHVLRRQLRDARLRVPRVHRLRSRRS